MINRELEKAFSELKTGIHLESITTKSFKNKCKQDLYNICEDIYENVNHHYK